MKFVSKNVMRIGLETFALLGFLEFSSAAITLDTSSEESIISAANTVAQGLMNYYHGNEYGYTPGIMSGDYYWWESGAAWGSMIDHWYFTQNTTYETLIMKGILFQTGDDLNFTPKNQTSSLGNDDQGFWGLTTMQATERNFTNPSSDDPQWLALSQAVFNSISSVWESSSCGGGVRWQKFTLNKGYNYKNSISNGVLFQLGARLARYTDNDTYAEWAEKIWDWETDIGLISDAYYVYDGIDIDSDGTTCSDMDSIQWTYNLGVFMAGCAYMYNYTDGFNATAADIWKTRLDGLIETMSWFTYESTSILYEPACELSGSCDVDQQSFKAYISRWMGLTIQVAPYTRDSLFPILQTSAAAAITTCSGGTDGVTCGYTWLNQSYDGSYGLGEQMAALEVTDALMIDYRAAPYTNTTGGSSTGDSSLGTGTVSSGDTVTKKDKIGAWVITVVTSLASIAVGLWCAIDSEMENTKNLNEWIKLDDL
ncbi:glycosyl hydrolase family 76-domain-containing protein [Lipomyces oligophaga]|uniref:glycosyl hydrolase family 76-domain-containing protein n=1 Tax=Lipomyces oligophaga TaxID=45792 RepID=UPI0034CE7FDD